MPTTYHDIRGGERAWDRSSRLALAFALFLLVYNGVLVWRSLQVPGDGWLWSADYRATPPEIVFTSQIVGQASPLQEGDRLLSIEGASTADLVARQFSWRLPPAPDWPDGTVLAYIVERDGQRTTVDVAVRRYGAVELIAAMVRLGGLPSLLQLAGSAFFFIVGVIVFVLRPRQRAAQALLILGTGFLFNAAPSQQWVTTFFFPFRPVSVPLDTWTAGINPSLMMMALSFPRPKVFMRRFPQLTVLALYLSAPLVINGVYLLNLDNPTDYYRVTDLVYVSQILLLLLLVFGSLIHSALTIRNPVARNQLKWLGLGLASFVLPGIGGWLLGFMVSGFQNNLVYLVSVAGWFIMPVCLAIAITRYRLFDIDVIIRRTVVYSTLTALLALVYLGSVVLLQQLARPVMGEESSLAIVISTLVIAALFTPARRRVQTIIDRRFYRRKYNAAQTLARFAETARDEVDLDRLVAQLMQSVQETVQPDSLSLWLKATPSPTGITARKPRALPPLRS